MPKNVAKAVRAAYEERPYPVVTRDALRRPRWLLPPVEWIQTVACPAQIPPRRILVAGCGTGLEAFAFRRRFPKAEIIAVDFAARSIRLAQSLQRRVARWRDVRFIRADLTNDLLARVTGSNFDFISCHGVMSYLPEPESALRNLARCLSSDGLLYLGVNGPMHFSETWRKFLPAFCFNMERWPGGERLARHLKFTASLAGDGAGRLLRRGPAYLASDLFGALIHNRSLIQWVRMCRAAGLHFRADHGTRRLLWPAINDGSIEMFLPRSRGEVAELLDVLRPGSFYWLIFSRQQEVLPPWCKPVELLKWRPLRTKEFDGFKWPARPGARVFKLESRASNISIELRGARWEVDVLRESNGERSLREILGPLKPTVAPATVRAQLYLFYLLDLLNLTPPDGALREGG